MKKITLAVMVMAMTAMQGNAINYYVSTAGSDGNTGTTSAEAFATLPKAIQEATEPGDTVFIEPGTYIVSETEMMGESSPYKLVYDFTHSGKEGKPICFIGQSGTDGNRPVFDFSNVAPADYRVTAFHIKASWLLMRNFDVIGVQNGKSGHSQSENFRLENASHCTLDNIAAHDGMGIGFYIMRHSADNLIVNCDAYNNYDTVGGSGKSGDGGNNDGFGCHVTSSADTGNMFIGCRAWNNTDDGFDLINCSAPVTIAYCFSAYSGYDKSNTSRGDGNGFKGGGYGMGASAVSVPADGFPRHYIHDNVAYRNKANGVYSNHHLGGVTFENNTSALNKNNYSFPNRRGTAATDNVDVNGYGHVVRNNVSYKAVKSNVLWLSADSANCTIEGNSFKWSGSAWTDDNISSFISTNYDDMKLAREASGMYNSKTTQFYQLANYSYGSDFSGYEAAVAAARRTCGAETGNATGIASLHGVMAVRDVAHYNVAGQRVADGYKGIVISKGAKKVSRQ